MQHWKEKVYNAVNFRWLCWLASFIKSSSNFYSFPFNSHQLKVISTKLTLPFTEQCRTEGWLNKNPPNTHNPPNLTLRLWNNIWLFFSPWSRSLIEISISFSCNAIDNTKLKICDTKVSILSNQRLFSCNTSENRHYQ